MVPCSQSIRENQPLRMEDTFGTQWLLLVLSGVLFVIYYVDSYLKWCKLARVINKLPGPKYYPIIGTLQDLWGPREKLAGLIKRQNERYGPLFRTWVGSFPVVHLLTAEQAEVVLKSSVNIDKGRIYRFMIPWLGHGLLTSPKQLWHTRRKLLTPAFHFKILEDFIDVFIEKGRKLVEILDERRVEGEYVDVFPLVKLCGLDIICKTAMGVELNAMDEVSNEYVEAVDGMSDAIVKRFMTPWYYNDFIFNRTPFGKKHNRMLSVLHGFTDRIINERKKAKKEGVGSVKKRLAFLDLLLEASEGGRVLSDEDIRNEVDTFMFGGHDTTTVATCWCLFLLGNNLDVQERLFDELDSVFGQTEGPTTASDLKAVPYLDMVIKEALRLYPSAPSVSRCLVEPVQLDGYEIPVGCSTKIHIDFVHRDPRHFPDPGRFDPENFSPERCQHRHPFAFIPFSAGPRNCIGQKFALLEEKVLLTTIVRKFRVYSAVRPDEIEVFQDLILRPQHALRLRLEPRL